MTTKPNYEEAKNFLLTQIATTFSEDKEFLKKVNAFTFGLVKDDLRKDRNSY